MPRFDLALWANILVAIIEADRFVSEPVHLSELEGLSIINGYAT